MNSIKFILFTFILMSCTYNVASAQNLNIYNNQWFAQISGFYKTEKPNIYLPFNELKGGSFAIENVIDTNFGLYLGYSYAESGNITDYFRRDNEYIPYTSNINVHSLQLGGNWYMISSDINNKFTPYIGAGLIINYSFDSNSGDDIESKTAINISYVPNLGLNIPIFGELGLRLESKYNISIYNFEKAGFVKRNANYLEFCLGVLLKL